MACMWTSPVGVFPADKLGSGTADASTFLRGDGSWQSVPGATAAWGAITGTLSSQTDLQGALDAKVPSSRTVNGKALTSDVSVTKADVSLGNCDNTSDAAKPVSTAMQTALNAKQDALGFTAVPNTRTVAGKALSADVTLVKGDVGLGSVENTALSTWSGSANLATVGTIGTGTWNATAIADGKIAAALTGKSYAGSTVTMTGAITTTGTGIGYASGAGGTVTQATSKSTGVTINKLCGTITMNGAALAAATIVSFTVTNSTVAATDVVHVQHDTVGTIGGYTVMPNTSAAGSFRISVRNNTAGSLSEAIVLRFAVIKAVTA